MAAGRTVPTFTAAMLASWLLFATVPLWIERVGLYQYLGVEILIFAIYALAFNLVLGHAGLPSFGHGAFFGIGAYAFGLAQFNIVPNLWLCLAVAVLAAALGGRARRALHLAPARHLLRADDHRLRPGVLVHRHQGAQHHRRRGRPAQDRAAACRPSASPAFDLKSNVALYYFVLAIFIGRLAAAVARWCIPRSAAWSRRSSRTRRAPASSATTCGATRPPFSSSRPRSRGSPAACSPWRRPRPSPTS